MLDGMMAAYKNLLRIYMGVPDLSAGQEYTLTDGQHHYLKNVMRAETGASLRVFNGRNGEWLAEIKELSKKKVIVSLIQKIAEQKNAPDIVVLASPVKKENFDIMVEKSCELGAAVFQPVICDHTIVHRANQERLQAIAVEAAEQSERTDVMQVAEIAPLKDILAGWDNKRRIVFCQERAAAPAIASVLAGGGVNLPLAVLIGPEGGFSAAEMEWLTQMPQIVPVSLGGRILRAETALIAALSCIQSMVGDWPDAG
jgi:16S rRNA (uracil1498-N3)-methyltransferase